MRRLFPPILLASALLGWAGGSRAEVIERVVAKVNGQIITLSDFETRQLEAAQAARIDPAQVNAFLRQNNAKILQQAIDDLLLLQKAEDAGIKPPEQYVDEVIESIKKEHNLTSEEQFAAALAREGLTADQLRKNIERSITQRIIVQREVEPKIAIAETDLQAEYQKLRETEFTKPATVRLEEIVVKDEGGGEALAREIVEKARAGEDFQALAKAHSAGPTAASGGAVGEVAVPDMDPQLREIALSLPVGGVSDPIRVADAHRIVKVVAKTPGSTTPYQAVRDKLRERLMNARFEKAYDAYLQELRTTARVELRVREVPLQLTGPIPEGSLLEGLEGGTPAPSTPAPAQAGPQQPSATSSGTGAAPPEPAAAASGASQVGGDEISSTPQAAAEHVKPAAPGASQTKETPAPAP